MAPGLREKLSAAGRAESAGFARFARLGALIIVGLAAAAVFLLR